MTITLNYYIIINKTYLYNYSDKIALMIMSWKIKYIQKYQNSILHDKNKQQINYEICVL